MNLEKIKKQWDDYNEEFDNSDFMDIDTHTSMALKVGELIDEIERLQEITKQNNLPLNPCGVCKKRRKKSRFKCLRRMLS